MGSGIPRVPVRMPGVGNARSEIAPAGRGSQPRHIEVGIVQVALQFPEDSPDTLLRSGVMDKRRLKLSQDIGVFLHLQTVLGFTSFESAECFPNHAAGKFAERKRA